MAFPGNAAYVVVKSVYFPPDAPHSGPGYSTKTSIRTEKHDIDFKLYFYPALRLLKVEKYNRKLGEPVLEYTGWVPEHWIGWMELCE
jgi:hypothetical protein